MKAAVVNVDDAKGLTLAQHLSQQSGLDLWTYSREGQGARLSAEQIELQGRGLAFDVLEDGQRVRLHSHMVGTYNVSNLLGVIAALRSQGFPLTDVVRACEQLQSVEGRMQQVPAQQADEPLVVVDYAHTPDALEKALLALKPLAEARGGHLHCVFGCGGNRDATKRPLMAGIAERIAHHAVLTTDNPRFEAPEAILADMVKGLADAAAAHVVIDRRDAIRQTVLGAGARDIVLVAGKGHEDYQEVQGVKHPFLDLAVAQEALVQRGGSAA
jgi:UDP-N-acetylmuramoyl-L-alanyl-D-glutamate--2,6-diaminopimelate ligase